MEMEGMEGAILIFMLGNMEQTVARKQTKGRKQRTETDRRVEAEGHMAVLVCRGSGVCFLPDGVL